jgi:predicted 2-oxoglutarate/Fe(II)-dependent dioxygenase YbiX
MDSSNMISVEQVDGIDLKSILPVYNSFVWYQAKIAESRYKNLAPNSTDKDMRDALTTAPDRELQEFLNTKIKDRVNFYAKENNINAYSEEYQLVKYSKGQFFSEHTDATEEFPRKISVLFYLNDDYEGGEIVFTKVNLSIKPKKNTLIIFPSTEEFSHSAEPVMSGTKYVIVGFWL